MSRSFSTIISSNYLPQAEVLIKSFKKHHPDDLFYLLLIDVYPMHGKIIDGVTLLTPEEIGVPARDLVSMRTYYDVVEFSTSLKPFLLMYLLKIGYHETTFLDPDIKIFSEIPSVFALEPEVALALTPHRLSPPVNKNRLNVETSFLKYGTFNLGYVSVSNNEKTYQFLEWWQEKLVAGCTRRVISEVFTDQKWIDLVPSFFQYSMVKDFGFNIAPWNLDERALSWVNDVLTVNITSSVKFVHFSQISQMLATEGLTSDWELKFRDSGLNLESKEIFFRLISDYTQELKHASSSGKFSKEISLLQRPYSNLNYVLRNALIDQPELPIRVRVIYPLINPLLNKLTKLDLINGLFWGLQSDIERFKWKYRSRKSNRY